MKNDNSKHLDELVDRMANVLYLQQCLILTAGHVRISIANGEVGNELLPVAQYLERMAGNLDKFVQEAKNPPQDLLDAGASVKTKPTFDPKAN